MTNVQCSMTNVQLGDTGNMEQKERKFDLEDRLVEFCIKNALRIR